MKEETIETDGRFLSDYSPEIDQLVAVASGEIQLGVVQIHKLPDYYNRFGVEGLQTVADRLKIFCESNSSFGVAYLLHSHLPPVIGRFMGVLFESSHPTIQDEIIVGLRGILADFPQNPPPAISLSFDLAIVQVQHGKDSANIISSLEEQLVRAAACVGYQGVFVLPLE